MSGVDPDHGDSRGGQLSSRDAQVEGEDAGGADDPVTGVGREGPIELGVRLHHGEVLFHDPLAERDVDRVEPGLEAPLVRPDLGLH